MSPQDDITTDILAAGHTLRRVAAELGVNPARGVVAELEPDGGMSALPARRVMPVAGKQAKKRPRRRGAQTLRPSSREPLASARMRSFR